MAAGPPARITWALRVVAPGPADRVLEVGCGPGVAAGLVCARLETGSMLAIDRSAVAVRRTRERNAAHVEAGRLEVRQCELAGLRVPPDRLDVAFSVNVNLFWTRSPAAELALLTAALRPGGRLCVLYGADGPGPGDRITTPVAQALGNHGLRDVTTITGMDGLGIFATVP